MDDLTIYECLDCGSIWSSQGMIIECSDGDFVLTDDTFDASKCWQCESVNFSNISNDLLGENHE